MADAPNDFVVGQAVKCRYMHGQHYYEATITAKNEDGTYDVFWVDGDHRDQRGHLEADLRHITNNVIVQNPDAPPRAIERAIALIRKAELKSVPKAKIKDFLRRKNLSDDQINAAYKAFCKKEKLFAINFEHDWTNSFTLDMEAKFGIVEHVLRKELKDDHGLERYCRVVKVGDQWIREESPGEICVGLSGKAYPLTITFQEAAETIDKDHFCPTIGRQLINYCSPFICDELCWDQGEEIFTLILSFLIHPKKTNEEEQPWGGKEGEENEEWKEFGDDETMDQEKQDENGEGDGAKKSSKSWFGNVKMRMPSFRREGVW